MGQIWPAPVVEDEEEEKAFLGKGDGTKQPKFSDWYKQLEAYRYTAARSLNSVPVHCSFFQWKQDILQSALPHIFIFIYLCTLNKHLIQLALF